MNNRNMSDEVNFFWNDMVEADPLPEKSYKDIPLGVYKTRLASLRFGQDNFDNPTIKWQFKIIDECPYKGLIIFLDTSIGGKGDRESDKGYSYRIASLKRLLGMANINPSSSADLMSDTFLSTHEGKCFEVKRTENKKNPDYPYANVNRRLTEDEVPFG